MPVRAVIFDGGGVLVQGIGDRSRKARWEQRLGLEAGMLDRAIWRLPVSQRANVGQATEDEVWQEVAQHFALSAAEADQLRADFFSDSVWNETLIGFVRASIHDHVNESMFDDMIFSAEVGLAKPDRRIYELALDRLRVQPVEAIFVDDVQENVEAAQAIGMAGVRFVSTEQTIADIEQYLKV